MMGDFTLLFVLFVLWMWAVIFALLIFAFEQKKFDDFLPVAGVACFASFLFMGPLCIAVMYACLLRGIWLDANRRY